MRSIVQPSHTWMIVVETFLAQEGLRQTTREQMEVIPEDLRDGIPVRFDRSAPIGVRPPTDAEIAAFYDRLTPHYDAFTMALYDLEIRTNAWLAEQIERLDPRTVVDAGCGTGITLGFLRCAFPRFDRGGLWGYDCSGAMIRYANLRRMLPLSTNHPTMSFDPFGTLSQNTHESFVQLLPDGIPNATNDGHPMFVRGGVDLLFTKNSFSAGVFGVPFFSEAPMPSAARENFYERDPTMQTWRAHLDAFATALRPGGHYIHIGVLADGPCEALELLADDAGFQLVTEYPVWFEQQPALREEDREHLRRILSESSVPSVHYSEETDRRWNWEAPASGALIFRRQ